MSHLVRCVGVVGDVLVIFLGHEDGQGLVYWPDGIEFVGMMF